jgi:hypothetical protein
VTENEKPDDGLLAMIKRAINPKQEVEPSEVEESNLPEAEQEEPVLTLEPVLEPIAIEAAEPIDQLEIAEPASKPDTTSTQSRIHTAHDVQKMISDALTTIPDAPKHGMMITVYGYRPWNAMVTFSPGSANLSTATMIRSALTRLVEEMRDHVDIEIPPN